MPPMSRFVAVSVVAIAVALLLCKEVARKDVGVRLGWGGGGKAQSSVELLDKKWVDAIPAFGSAMSSDDLSRQIHWLHKHNAAKQKQRRHRAAVSTQPLDLVESDGSALVPENRAAIKYMSSIVENAYDDEAGVVAAKSEGDRDTMQERLKAEVRLAARTTMMEMGRDATVKITPEAIHVLQKALGGAEVAHLCHKLSLPCPITSVGNAAEGDEIAGFGSSSTATAAPRASSNVPSLQQQQQQQQQPTLQATSLSSSGTTESHAAGSSSSVQPRKDISDRGIRILEDAAKQKLEDEAHKQKHGERAPSKQRRKTRTATIRRRGRIPRDERYPVSLGSETAGSGGKARLQDLLMAHHSGGVVPPLLPYDPPSNLYLWWGEETNKREGGDVGSGGGGQNIRSILHMGTIGGGEWRSKHFVGEGGGFSSQRLRRMADACCTTIVFPPLQWNFPVMNTNKIQAQNLRKYVANGNTIVLTGDIISKEFLNRYFFYNVEEADGGYSTGPWYKVDGGTFKAFEASPKVLPQKGISVIPMKKGSLPSGATVLWGDSSSAAVFQIKYCEAERSDGTGASKVLPADCEASGLAGRPCSCGSIIYIGYSFPDNYPSRWGKVLEAAGEYGAVDGKGRALIGAKSAAEQKKEEEKRAFQVARRAAARAQRQHRAVEKARDVALISKLIDALSGGAIQHLGRAFDPDGVVVGLKKTLS